MTRRVASFLRSRVECPCCGYPTLESGENYEICELCNWEDDGQGDEDADEVRGGPNSDYSLNDARRNFRQYRVMYAPCRDQRTTCGDSAAQYEAKGLLMRVFAQLSKGCEDELPSYLAEIERLEAVLRAETERNIRAYEGALRGDA